MNQRVFEESLFRMLNLFVTDEVMIQHITMRSNLIGRRLRRG